jgi:putative drug exporter of the RND superfamily
VLVPSVMSILGPFNWYLPGWLSWLPDLSIEGGPARSAGTAAPDHTISV